jgi:hypothetical protein
MVFFYFVCLRVAIKKERYVVINISHIQFDLMKRHQSLGGRQISTLAGKLIELFFCGE